MKKLAVILISIICFSSCDLDDTENVVITYETVPIESVSIPDTLVYGESYDFDINYRHLTTCHSFEGFDYQKDGHERTISVINRVYNDSNTCEELEEVITEKLNFNVQSNDFYIFNFWTGTNSDGTPVYITKEVPVVEE